LDESGSLLQYVESTSQSVSFRKALDVVEEVFIGEVDVGLASAAVVSLGCLDMV
jgi:hypothetical protein